MADNALLASLLMGQKRRNNPNDAMRSQGQKLIISGTSTAPVQSPLEGLARALQAGIGGYTSGLADQREEERGKKTSELLGRMMGAKTDQELADIAKEGGGDPDVLNPLLGQMIAGNMDRRQKNSVATNAYTAAGGVVPGAPAVTPSPQITQTPLAAPAGMSPQTQQQGQNHVNYLVNVHGFTPEQAQMMVGNLVQESALDPANGFDPKKPGGDGGTAAGMGQWRLDRRDALIREAQARGEDPSNPTTQLDFFANEFKSRPEFQQFQNAKTPEERQAALMTYFRPAGYTPSNPQGGDGYANRLQYGQQFGGNAQQPGQPLTVNMTPQGSADAAVIPTQATMPAAPQAPRAPQAAQISPAAAELSRQAQAAFQAGDPTRAAALQQKAQEVQATYAGEIDKERRTQQTKDYNDAQTRAQPTRGEIEKLHAARSEAATIVSALEDFRREFENTGTWGAIKSVAGATTPVNTAYNTAALLAKGEQLFNLGVLNGPDLDIIRRTLPDPSTPRGAMTSTQDMGAAVGKVIDLLQTRLAARESQLGLPVTDVRGAANNLRATMPGGPAQQPANGPIAPGAIEEGYRFKGGNPADKNNWERVQ